MDKNEKVLSIIDKLLNLVENKDLDEKLDKWVEYMVTEEEPDDEGLEEEREEVTEDVKDYSPSTLKEENKKLKEKIDEQAEFIQGWYKMYRDADEERTHLKNLIDMICNAFWLEKYETNWKLWVAWDKGLIEEIAKARKKLK